MLQAAIDDLARSGIAPEDAHAAGMQSVADASRHVRDAASLPGLLIPYLTPDGDPMMGDDGAPFCRVRYLGTPPLRVVRGKLKPQRYAQAPGSGVHPYFPRVAAFDWRADVLDDPSQYVVITEGEKKALAACLQGIPTIGLGGVYNFMSQGAFVDALDRIDWRDRPVYIAYDSDAPTNPSIQAAEARLATELSLKRRARVYLVRLPPGPDDAKQGLDDLLLAQGVEALEALLTSSSRMRRIDSAVVQLNRDLAWIESEALIYDLSTGGLLRKEHLTSGSRYSAIHVDTLNLKTGQVRQVQVAKVWLTHPHAQRYHAMVFDPSNSDATVPVEGGLALNTWRGFDTEDGDVEPFLELDRHVMSELEPEHRDFALRLMCYKAQNPAKKIPLALVMLGPQGSGKSMWAKAMRQAFGVHGQQIDSHALISQFNGYIERSLLCVFDEAQAAHVVKGADVLKSLISEDTIYLNEKFRIARQVRNYSSLILTSNDPRVGAHAVDDRRYFVIGAPPPADPGLYARVGRWMAEGGPKRLMGWMLARDLGGWTPPQRAPLTAEKAMASREALTPIALLARDMLTADEHTVVAWIESSRAWAQAHAGSSTPAVAQAASDILAATSRLQIRPWYTAEELAMMFPSMLAQIGVKGGAASPGVLSRQLREAGIRYLRPRDNPEGFRWRGLVRPYLVVAAHDEWCARSFSQQEFEHYMRQFPSYGDLVAQKSA